MLPKKSSIAIKTSNHEVKNEELLKLYTKEYHEGHRDWAMQDTPIYRHYRDNYMNLIQPKSGSRVLELGCSAGKTSVELAKRGCEVIAVDFDQKAIDIAKSYAIESQVNNAIEFICSSADSMELMNKKFDQVTMLDFVEHVPDQVIQNIFKNLKSIGFKGNICIYTPDRHHYTEILASWGVISGDSTHINLKSRKEWITFLTDCDVKIKSLNKETSHWKFIKSIERAFNSWPLIGGLLTRSISITCKV